MKSANRTDCKLFVFKRKAHLRTLVEMAHVCLSLAMGHLFMTSSVHSAFNFQSLNMLFIQCGAYLRVSFICKVKRIASFKLPV